MSEPEDTTPENTTPEGYDDPEVIAHSAEYEDTPCGIHICQTLTPE